MVKSMTGFASITREEAQATVTVTVKTLNHRYLDVQCRVPGSVAEIETRLRALVQRRLARGRVELGVSLTLRETPEIEVELNETFGAALSAALDRARAQGMIAGTLAAGDLLRLPQALTIRERPAVRQEAETARLLAWVEASVDEALTALDAMRQSEGDHVRADLDARRSGVADLVERVAVAADEGRAGVETRLKERVAELAAQLPADPTAIAQEIVRTAARADISEEVARFRGHVAHWRALSDGPEPCGRKLDFLLQEMNREVNTMGSKADGLSVSELIISAKAELEKMREQVQNVE